MQPFSILHFFATTGFLCLSIDDVGFALAVLVTLAAVVGFVLIVVVVFDWLKTVTPRLQMMINVNVVFMAVYYFTSNVG
jgi:hypothetical protein